jgi:hypothetical protein
MKCGSDRDDLMMDDAGCKTIQLVYGMQDSDRPDLEVRGCKASNWARWNPTAFHHSTRFQKCSPIGSLTVAVIVSIHFDTYERGIVPQALCCIQGKSWWRKVTSEKPHLQQIFVLDLTASRLTSCLFFVRRNEDAIEIKGDNIEPVLLDVTRQDQIAALVEVIKSTARSRPLRALVNNAAIQINAPIETLSLSEWRRLFEVNLFGQVAITQALLPALIQSHGTIVNISSVGGKVAMATYGPYAASKVAFEAVSDSLRRELEPSDVKVVVIEPGAIKTKMLQ